MEDEGKIKRHFKKYKYIYVGGGVVIAGITLVIMRQKSLDGYSRPASELMGIPVLSQTSVQSFSGSKNHVKDSFNRTTINYVNRLSYITKEKGTDRWWTTQADAAKAIGSSTSDVSKHINHGKPLPNGVELERMGVKAA
jgi:hypothetical protein